MADRKFSQDMAGAWGLMRQKEKVLMILQSILTAILLIFIIIDVGMGMNKGCFSFANLSSFLLAVAA